MRLLVLMLVLISGSAFAGTVKCANDMCQVAGPVDAATIKAIESQPHHDKLHVFLTSGKNEDLAAIAKLTWLTSMMISGDVSDVSSLASLAHLRNLAITTRHVTAAPVVAKLGELEILSLSMTSVADISPLKTMSKLRRLDVSPDTKDLAPLASLTGLTSLGASRVKVASWEPLKKLTALEKLSLDESNVDVAVVAGLKKLKALDLRATDVKNLRALTGLAELTDLHLGMNAGLKDISALAKLTHLREVFLNETAVTDLSPLKTSTTEKSLDKLYVPKSASAASLAALKQLNADLTVEIDQ